jgi:uncharacterized protein (DUF983 family)
MFDALSGMACFVTATVSFLYGTRIAWLCGKRCNFNEECEYKKQTLRGNLPAAIVVYFFGFLVVFSVMTNGLVTVVISALTSAILLSSFVVSMSMPSLKRNPSIK